MDTILQEKDSLMPSIGPLLPYQLVDIPWFLSHPKSMILYEPRLRKTATTIIVMARDPLTKRVLIVCSKNALLAWMEHLPLWWPYIDPSRSIEVRIVRGKNSKAKATREALWTAPRRADVTFFVTTFEAFVNDYDHIQKYRLTFDTVIGDEVHRKFKTRKGTTVTKFREFIRDVRRFHPLSGTLAGKWGPADLWTLLNMLNKSEFGSYWRHAETFCWLTDGQFGKEIIGVRNQENWLRTLHRYARVRKRADVAPQMPTVQRDIIRPEWTQPQLDTYNSLEKVPYTFTPNGTLIVAANSLEKFIRRRQLLICPAILDPLLGYGGAITDLLAKCVEAREEGDLYGHHIVIFTAYTKAIPFIQAAFEAEAFKVFTIQGGTEPEELRTKIDAFTQTKGIVICSVKFAQGFSLESAQQCFFIGPEYDPNENKQAEDRLVPQIGTHPINSWYYSMPGANEDIDLIENLGARSNVINATLG